MNRNKNEKGHPKLTVFNYFLIPVPRLLSLYAIPGTRGPGILQVSKSRK